jgi:glucose/arabinose dehydrogenase
MDKNFVSAAIFACVLLVDGALAQEDTENPPTLKLDRIMSSPSFMGQTRAPAAKPSEYEVETIARGLAVPWAIAFLPNDEILISEYATGNMRVLDAQRVLSTPVDGLPEISHEGWAGLFDIALDPDYEQNHTLYFSYTAPSGDAEAPNIPRVARARFDRAAMRIGAVEVLLDGTAWQELHFAADGTLLASGTGSGEAQDLAVPSGKLLRINTDGSAAMDNPFADHPQAMPEIYSYGHRDISGIATRPGTGDIWITEHGPRGGDELNLIKPGANFGWEVISYGTDYTGESVGAGQSVQDGMEQPRYFWRPSIAPSGLMFYSGDMFPEWRGNIFVTALSGQHISRLVLDGDRVIAEERLLVDRAVRMRELRQGPDGALYALTNEEGDASKGTAELLRIYK